MASDTSLKPTFAERGLPGEAGGEACAEPVEPLSCVRGPVAGADRWTADQLAEFDVTRIGSRLTEQEVVARCVEGDGEAWSWLVRRFERVVGKQMWRFSRDRGVWEELVQDVFVEVFRSLPRYVKRGVPLEHWVRRIATRVGYRHWKQMAVQQRRAQRLETWGRESQRSAAPPVDRMEPAEAGELLHRLLARLAPADRLVLTLLHLEECDTKQIAEQTGWTRAMVKMRAMRARRRLQQIATEEGFDEALGD